MENLNGLLSAAFLILIAAAAAVTGSMVVLGLFDRLFSKKKSPAPDPESPGGHEGAAEAFRASLFVGQIHWRKPEGADLLE